jgi:hypothetical protein
MSDLGVVPHSIQKILNHTLQGVLAVCNRAEYETERLLGFYCLLIFSSADAHFCICLGAHVLFGITPVVHRAIASAPKYTPIEKMEQLLVHMRPSVGSVAAW